MANAKTKSENDKPNMAPFILLIGALAETISIIAIDVQNKNGILPKEFANKTIEDLAFDINDFSKLAKGKNYSPLAKIDPRNLPKTADLIHNIYKKLTHNETLLLLLSFTNGYQSPLIEKIRQYSNRCLDEILTFYPDTQNRVQHQ